MGMLWGLTPCALVYSVLPLALLAGGALQGALVMLAFGIATLPNLVVAGYALNELSDAIRRKVEDALIAAGKTGAQILVAEPIARGVAPWWDDAAARFVEAGGRADEWRFPVELPPLLRLFDRATGLRHDVLTARTLSMNIDSR